jgi:3-deoxy-D-manno-octulosonate 8-phosphate phosphatase (KDO 8-P phosphatase)
VQDKIKAFESLRNSLGLILEEIAAIGDDVVDLPILTRCGFAACVPAAPGLVKQRVHYVTQAHGGHGAVREFCELILQAQGKLDGQLKRYLA